MKKINLWLMFFINITLLSAQNESKLVIDASEGQTNSNPLIRLRNSAAEDLLWMHSDHISNAFIGVNAGVNNSGFNNSFIGASAGASNQSASFNTALGNAALNYNSSGFENTAVGFYALFQSVSGGFNTAIGSQALMATNGAQYNVAVGYHAGGTWNNGYNNVFVGANTDVSTAQLFNVVAVGQGTGVGASSTARIGNSATGSIGGYANWSNISDGRFKKNVQTNVPGLDFILKLEPVTYNLDVINLSKALHENQDKEWDDQMRSAIAEKEKMVQTGFIAQDVEKIAKALGYDFSGVDAPKNENDIYGLRYAEFVVPLVKAVQEINEVLNQQNQELTAAVEGQKKENQLLVERLEKLEKLYRENEVQYTSLDSPLP